jgi:hypothetical protein
MPPYPLQVKGTRLHVSHRYREHHPSGASPGRVWKCLQCAQTTRHPRRKATASSCVISPIRVTASDAACDAGMPADLAPAQALPASDIPKSLGTDPAEPAEPAKGESEVSEYLCGEPAEPAEGLLLVLPVPDMGDLNFARIRSRALMPLPATHGRQGLRGTPCGYARVYAVHRAGTPGCRFLNL